MNNANKTYEMYQIGTSGFFGVRCIETGTETLRAMSRGAAARVLRALRGSVPMSVIDGMTRDEIVSYATAS
jgi:hypothetical protein